MHQHTISVSAIVCTRPESLDSASAALIAKVTFAGFSLSPCDFCSLRTTEPPLRSSWPARAGLATTRSADPVARIARPGRVEAASAPRPGAAGKPIRIQTVAGPSSVKPPRTNLYSMARVVADLEADVRKAPRLRDRSRPARHLRARALAISKLDLPRCATAMPRAPNQLLSALVRQDRPHQLDAASRVARSPPPRAVVAIGTGAHDLVGDPADLGSPSLATSHPASADALDLAADQRRRGACMLSPRVPWASRRLGREIRVSLGSKKASGTRAD